MHLFHLVDYYCNCFHLDYAVVLILVQQWDLTVVDRNCSRLLFVYPRSAGKKAVAEEAVGADRFHKSVAGAADFTGDVLGTSVPGEDSSDSLQC